MTRRLFTFASAVSLALFAVLVVLWVMSYRSHRTRMAIEFWRADGLWEVASRNGRLWLDNDPQREFEWETPFRKVWTRRNAELNRRREAVLAFWQKGTPNYTAEGRAAQRDEEALAVEEPLFTEWAWRYYNDPIFNKIPTPPVRHSLPYPAPVAATALMPFAWFISAHITRRRQTVWRAMGLCVRCGYDLRASRDKCPECGSILTSAPKISMGNTPKCP